MKFKNLFGFGKLTALGCTQEDAQGHKTSGSISVCHPQVAASSYSVNTQIRGRREVFTVYKERTVYQERTER